MKVVFTTPGDTLKDPLDNRFGRAAKFLIYDLDSNTFAIKSNEQSMTAAQGAGVQAAESVVRTGAKALVTGHCGPKAFRVLSAAGVKVFNCSAGTVAEALAEYTSGKLTEASAADVEGHWV